MQFLKNFPDPDNLIAGYDNQYFNMPPRVNNHIHTPYSFSAFHSVEEATDQADREGVQILGINDFYVSDGYTEFVDSCLSKRIFPLLNMELIGISKTHQEKGIRINDPKNPGRIYISGKGFPNPPAFTDQEKQIIRQIVDGSNEQVAQMIELLNEWMKQQGLDLALSAEEIIENHAMNLLRERHVARRLRMLLEPMEEKIYLETLTALYGGTTPLKPKSDIAGTEDELRSRLLKAGAPAFVPEDESAFLPMEEILEMIRNAGGVPTYPMLLDGAGDIITEFEASRETLKEVLQENNIRAIELIPLRNDHAVLKSYATWFYEQGFVVSFGTEHNTSANIPLNVTAKGWQELDNDLKRITFLGAAWQAAHQYLAATKGIGYQDPGRDAMEQLGQAVLYYYFENYSSNI